VQPQTKNRIENYPYTLVYLAGAMGAVFQGVHVLVAYNTVVYDDQAQWTGAPQYRFYPRKAGLYLLSAKVRWNLGNGEWTESNMILNNVLSISRFFSERNVQWASNGEFSAIRELTPNDFITIDSYWSGSLAGRALVGGLGIVQFCAVRLR
jgi:hypothetical protein